jgi:hypothetical protein
MIQETWSDPTEGDLLEDDHVVKWFKSKMRVFKRRLTTQTFFL